MHRIIRTPTESISLIVGKSGTVYFVEGKAEWNPITVVKAIIDW